MPLREQDVLKEALAAGFARAALLPVRPLLSYRPNAEAVRQQICGDPLCQAPWAASVLVAAMPYEWFSAPPKGCVNLAAFFLQSNRAYAAMRSVQRSLAAQGVRADAVQHIPSKQWAMLAGFGQQGRNTLLHAKPWGTCFTVQTLLTDVVPQECVRHLPPVPSVDDACGACRRCVLACPTGALDGQGGMDPEKCLRTWQLRGLPVPLPLREKMGVRLLGCDICQRACPRNAAVPSLPPQELFGIDELLRFTPQTRRRLGAVLGTNEARPLRVRAQALLAAGNSGDPALLGLVQPLCTHESPAVAEHAVWAFHRLRGEE